MSNNRRMQPSMSAHIMRARTSRLAIRLGALGTLGLVACTPTVKVDAPTEPIEINLNVKIEHEVRVKLDEAVKDTISDRPDLFGQEVTK